MLLSLLLSSASVLLPPLVLGDCVKPVVESGTYLEFTHITLNRGVKLESVQDQMIEVMNSSQWFSGNLMSRLFMGEDSFMLLEKWNETSGQAYRQEFPNRFTKGTRGVLPYGVSSSTWYQLDAESHKPLFEIPSTANTAATQSYCTAPESESGFTLLKIKSDYVDAVKNKMADMVKVSRKEEGNNFYISMQGSTDDEQFLVVEQWYDHDALLDHMKSVDVLRLLGFSKLMIQEQGMKIKGGFKELVAC